MTTLGSQTAGRSGSYSNGVWTLTGLGNDVWNDTTDDAQFDYHTMTGDGAIVARVTSSQVVNAKTKAGLMIRDNLTANVSQRAWIGITNGNLLESHLRGWTLGQIWGGSNRDDRSSTLPPGIPYWLKVERQGNFISTYSSLDGTSWAAELHAYYANLPSTVYMGLFVCSGSTSTPTTATFDHVAFTGGTGGLVTTPAAPASVFAAGSSRAITVRWLPSFGATGYDLLRSNTSGGGYTVIASNLSTGKTSYVDTAVTAGTTYYYVVRAKNAAGTSGNSPEYGDSLVPLSMSNLAFSGTATASYSNSNPLEVPSEAFDSDPGSKWFDSAAPTGWLQKDFGANNAQVVKRYTIDSADVATRDPKDWTLLGSQDGVNWTTLDSQSGQLFDYRMQQKTYNIANTTAYRYYRLNVTANNGATGLAIAELGLWSDTGRTLADGRYRLVSRRSNKVMGVDGGATSSGAQLSQSDWTGSDSQQWDLVWQGNGQYRATSVASGKVIDNGGTSNTGAVLNIQPWSGGSRQLWQVLPDSDGFYRFKSVNSGLVADVSGGSTASGAKIIQWTASGSDNQQWMFSIGSAPQPAAAAPSALSATAGSISSINLAWTASPDAVSYNVKRATASGEPFATIATGVNTPSYQDTYLTPNTTYYYVVSPVNGSGEGADSAPASATTPAGAPAAPTGVSAKPGTGQVVLTWAMTGGATSYTLKRATASSGPYTTVASNLAGTTYTDTGLT
ncbi:MAG: RICIN domain-containing protein, partial [Tepidisphaeraceae bacterium]